MTTLYPASRSVGKSTTIALGRAADQITHSYALMLMKARIHDTWVKKTFSKGVDLAVKLINEQRRNPQPPTTTS